MAKTSVTWRTLFPIGLSDPHQRSGCSNVAIMKNHLEKGFRKNNAIGIFSVPIADVGAMTYINEARIGAPSRAGRPFRPLFDEFMRRIIPGHEWKQGSFAGYRLIRFDIGIFGEQVRRVVLSLQRL